MGFFPARENRSSAWACTRNQPRACAAQMQTQTRCATCPAQPRDLLAAGAGLRRTFSSYLSPFSVWLLPLNFLFICRSGRDGPLLSSEKKVDKDSRGGAVAPPSNPHACALRPISPFPALLAGLAALRAANRRQIKETPEKPRSKAPAFRAFLCVGDAPGLLPGGFLPGRREQEVGVFPARENRSPAKGPHLEKTACVRGSNADTNTVRDLSGAAARIARRRRGVAQDFFLLSFAFSCWLLPLKPLFICRSCRDGHPIFFSERKWGKRTARGRYRAPFEPPFLCPEVNQPLFLAAGRLSGPSGRKPPADKGNARKAKGAKLSFSGVSVRGGCAGAFARRVSSRPQGTGGGLSPCPGK